MKAGDMLVIDGGVEHAFRNLGTHENIKKVSTMTMKLRICGDRTTRECGKLQTEISKDLLCRACYISAFMLNLFLL